MNPIKKDQLKWRPICLETPMAEVYQCENGHMVCHKCSLKVGPNCPQCRVPFGEKKIRNLIVESLLDDMMVNVPCSSLKYGCFRIMKNRQEAEAHNKTCVNRAVSICHALGYPDCKTKVRTGGELISHLERAHYDVCEASYSLKTAIYSHIGCIVSNETQYYLEYVNSKGMEPCLLVVKVTPDSTKRKFKCASSVLYLGDGPYQNAEKLVARIDIDVFGVDFEKKVHIGAWTGGRAVHYKKAADDEEFNPLFSTTVDLNFIKSQLQIEDESDLSDLGFRIKVKLTKAIWVSVSDDDTSSGSSDESSGDDCDSDGSRISNSERRSKRHLEPDSGGSSKRMKRDSNAGCRCINCKVHTSHSKKKK